MSRIIRIILYSIFFILIFLALSGIYEGCHENQLLTKQTAINENLENESTATGEIDNIADEYFEDEERNGQDRDSISLQTKQEPIKSAPENSGVIKTPVESPEPKQLVSQPDLNSLENTPASGKYIVIAGSFSIRENAEMMVSRLKKMGYPNAQVFQFDGKQYFTVRAGDFQDMEEARKMSGALKQAGIDTYVHTKD